MKGLKKSSVQLWLCVFFLWRPGSVFSCSSCLYNEILGDTLLTLLKAKGQGHFHTRESPQCYPPTTQIGSSKIASHSNFWWGKLLRIRFFLLWTTVDFLTGGSFCHLHAHLFNNMIDPRDLNVQIRKCEQFSDYQEKTQSLSIV